MSAEKRAPIPEPVPDHAQARVQVLAPAKLNLFLHVGEKREDGYHALQSLVAFAETGDAVEAAPAAELSLKVSGPFGAQVPRGNDNLVLKAAQALYDRYPEGAPGALIKLEKNLPVAAGLGSGSADAASTLRALNLLWRLERTESELLELAKELGSDVSACLLARPCWMEGRGERVADIPSLPPLPIVLVNPGLMLPTAKVFEALNARTGIEAMTPPRQPIETLWDLIAYLEDSGNDLEAPACRLQPTIDEVLEALDREPACVLAQMSGSGATCFALFDGVEYASGAAERIAEENPTWWVRATKLASPDIGTPRLA